MTGPRGEALRQRREARFDSWFRDRRWRVCTEITGDRVSDTGIVRYSGGFFRMDPPGIFQTPLGHKGRAGYLIQEVDPDGGDRDVPPVPFGRRTLEHAIEKYGAVSGLPAKDPKVT